MSNGINTINIEVCVVCLICTVTVHETRNILDPLMSMVLSVRLGENSENMKTGRME